MVAVSILAVVILAVTGILLSSNRLESRTVTRAEVQASSRQALSIMTTELRQAGADPSNPPVGIVVPSSFPRKSLAACQRTK